MFYVCGKCHDGTQNMALISAGLKYLHHIPESRRRRLKGNPLPKGITGPPCHWRALIERRGPPGQGLNASLMTLLCKKGIVAKS
jgi:hypothetical protein